MFFTAKDEDMSSQSSDKDEIVSAYRNLQKGNYTVTCTFSQVTLVRYNPNLDR